MNKENILKYFIAVICILAAGTFFLPLVSLNLLYETWSGSMRDLLSLIDTAAMAMGGLGEMFMNPEEAEQLSMIMNLRYLLYIPYLFAVISAVIVLLGKKKGKFIITIILAMINIIVLLGATFLADTYLEQYFGETYYMEIISIWNILDIGFWGLIVSMAMVIVISLINLLTKAEDKGNASEITEDPNEEPGDLPIEEPVSEIPVGMIMGLSGEYKGMQVTIQDNETVIMGRDGNECNLIISGSKVSRKHCSISYYSKTNRYLLTDYSSNGTFMNDGKRIPPNTSVEIMPGTVIYLGNRDNSFQIG